MLYIFFFFNDAPTPEIYTLSLHDALPISLYDRNAYEKVPSFISADVVLHVFHTRFDDELATLEVKKLDRKSTRLNSSHVEISYAVFCLKKKTRHVPVHPCLCYVPLSAHST